MSDKGRRRKATDSGDSEKLSEDSYEDNEIVKGSEEEGELNASTEGTRESEYETVEDDTETDDSTAVDEEDDDDSVIIEYEREEGDGQESIPPKEKKLDDDEDRRNPQYIPKRGTFYEHDDRTATEDVSGGETNEKETADRASKEGLGGGDSKAKKVWREHENRWSHDRYNEDEQAPKSREELIAIYGYDIRNEEGPPRARRRRRYGRGPNKYTRNWEDEDAYSKPQVPTTPTTRGGRRGGRRGGSNQSRNSDSEHQEEFPPLINNRQDNNENSNSSVDQNLPIPGSTYSNRTMGVRKHNKEDESSNLKSQQDAFPPLESELQRIQISGNQESVNRTQISTNSSSTNNREESGGVSKSSAGRRVQRDIRDGPLTDAGSRGGRGRGRSRGRGIAAGGVDVVPGSALKGQSSTRSLSETRLPPDSVQHHDSGSDSAPPLTQHHHHHHHNSGPPPASFQVANRPQDEVPREYHRRSNKNGHPQHHHPQQQQPPPPSQQSQPGVSGSERRQQMVVPPRMQHQQQQHQQDNSGSNRPKRYSSLRQRSLPESGVSYAQPPPTTAYYQPAAGYVTQQPVYSDTPQHPQTAGTPPVQLLTPHPHPPTPTYAAPFPSPTATFVGPPPPRMLPPVAGAPPTFIPAPTPGTPIINYVGPPPTYTAFQGYTAVPTPGPPPPAELYQPQGGITYYNTEEQNIVPRPITQKRQRSAIPIVPPPERIPRGRGRTNREDTSAGSPVGAGVLHSVLPPAVPSPPAEFEDAPPSNSTTPTATKVA